MEKRLLLLLFSFIFIIGCTIQQPYLDENSKEDESSNLPTEQPTTGSVGERHWKRVFAKAFETVDCPASRDPSSLPDGYYKGPMIDTHIHSQNLPDGVPGFPDDYYTGDNLGIKRSMEEWVCMINVEGTKQVWGFFPVAEPIVQESVEVVKITLEKYPNIFVPFINPPGKVKATVDAEELEMMLNVEPGLFRGYGEIGLYENTNSPPLSPNSTILMEIYPVIEKYKLIVYFHLDHGQKESFQDVARANPNITFVFHGGNLFNISETQAGISHDEKVLVFIEELLYNNPNIYYTVNELYGGDWLLEPGRSKEKFLENFADYETLLEIDLPMWKGFIERHPDQVLFGTDRGGPAIWDKDPNVALTLNNYTRVFIDSLDPSVQEKFAYKNAERIIDLD
ncbi:MAG: amidohydrolase family protein [Nanoarchaeota archaeon]